MRLIRAKTARRVKNYILRPKGCSGAVLTNEIVIVSPWSRARTDRVASAVAYGARQSAAIRRRIVKPSMYCLDVPVGRVSQRGIELMKLSLQMFIDQ